MQNNPKVSVVIPTHNRPELLKRAIQSVLDQSFQDFEIIVVDDGAEERGEEVVSGFRDKRINYVANQVSEGAPATRNKGMVNSKGEYIAFLDDDDEWLKDKLKKQVEALEREDKSVVMVFCGIKKYDEHGNFIEEILSKDNGVVWPFEEILRRSYIWTSTIMIRKEVMQKGVMFDVNLKKNQEWDLELQLLKIGKFYSINESLVKLNILGEDQHLGGKKNIKNIIDGFIFFINKHQADYKKNKKALAFCYLRLATMYVSNDQREEAIGYMYKSWKTQPRQILTMIFLIKLLFRYRKMVFRKIYLYFKPLPVIGGIVQVMRNLYSKSFLKIYFLNRRDIYEVRRILIEITGNAQEVDRVVDEAKRAVFMNKMFSHGQSCNYQALFLFGATRLLRLKNVIETGVASGRSSTSILEAMKKNNEGRLCSIDLFQEFTGEKPKTYMTSEGNTENEAFIPSGKMPGWLIPQNLRDRWELIIGKSSEKLPQIVNNMNSVDLFFHDSEHSYDNMTFEFNTVWNKIPEGGLLVCDDYKWNDAFADFVNKTRVQKVFRYRSFGVLVK